MYLYNNAKIPINLLKTTANKLNIKVRGYNKIVETNTLIVVAIEYFLNSPFACKMVKKTELKKFKLTSKPKIIEININSNLYSKSKNQIKGICTIWLTKKSFAELFFVKTKTGFKLTLFLDENILENLGIKLACKAFPKVICEKKSETVLINKKFA